MTAPNLLNNAIQNENWEKVASLIELYPDFMADGLARVYPLLPVEYKFSIPINCYMHHGYLMPAICKYVRQARKLLPVERRVPAELLTLPEVMIYRAGAEPIGQAANRISWTTSLNVAKWFYERARLIREHRRLYKGVIAPDRIIWYKDGRKEKEVIQYRGVKDIVELNPAPPNKV